MFFVGLAFWAFLSTQGASNPTGISDYRAVGAIIEQVGDQQRGWGKPVFEDFEGQPLTSPIGPLPALGADGLNSANRGLETAEPGCEKHGWYLRCGRGLRYN